MNESKNTQNEVGTVEDMSVFFPKDACKPVDKTENTVTTEYTLESLAGLCDNATLQSGGYYLACCPAHNDRNPSLQISQGEDGRIWFKCFAGCDNNAITEALGLPKDWWRKDVTYVYQNADGTEAYEVLRKEWFVTLPDGTRKKKKNFPIRHKDANGEYINHGKGVRLVLFRLPDVIANVAAGNTIYIVEGEKDALTLEKIGLCATTAKGGAGAKWEDRYTEILKGADVVIIPDTDTPGLKHAAKIREALRTEVKSLKIHVLDDAKDVTDWLQDGGDKVSLLLNIDDTPFEDLSLTTAPVKAEIPDNGLPMIEVPSADYVKTHEFIETLAVILKGLPIERSILKTPHKNGYKMVRIMGTPKALVDVERHGIIPYLSAICNPVSRDKDGDIQNTVWHTGLTDIIINSPDLKAELNTVLEIRDKPVLVEVDGQLQQVQGYNADTQIYYDAPEVPEMSVQDAVKMLMQTTEDFKFVCEGDKARCIASYLSPAIAYTQLFREFKLPLELAEADQSQTGKSYKTKLTAAMYGQAPSIITQRANRAQLEEAVSEAVLQGSKFISFDNIRGEFDSQFLEVMLSEKSFFARVLFQAGRQVAVNEIQLSYTSNQATVKKDLANRASNMRLLKQDPSYVYKLYPGRKDLFLHVLDAWLDYQGAIYAIIKDWYANGAQRDETGYKTHDNKCWVGIMGHICKTYFNLDITVDMLESRLDVSDVGRQWLRDVCLNLPLEMLGTPLTLTQMLTQIYKEGEPETTTPSYLVEVDAKVKGKLLAALWQQQGVKDVKVSGYNIHRSHSYHNHNKIWMYTVTKNVDKVNLEY